MYKSTYLAVRVQSDTDLDIRPPPCEVDIMLWLIDVYDLPSSNEAAEAVKGVILEHYLLLNSSVPGLMMDWTKGMMAWVTYLHALVPSFEYDQEWVIQQELMIKRDPHKWTVSDLRVILDALSMRWNNAHAWDRDKIQQYLTCIWSVAKKYTMNLHLNMPEGVVEGKHFKIRPIDITRCYARFYWFNKTLELLDAYEREVVQLDTAQHFFKVEERHFVLRKFRDGLLKFSWTRKTNIGDIEIASHGETDNVSAYSAIYKRQPVCLLQQHQKDMLYAEVEDVLQIDRDAVYIKMVQAYFMSNFKHDFVQIFMCFERAHPKHKKAVENSLVPIIVEFFGHFSVIHEKKAYGFGTFENAFVTWVKMAKHPYGIDIRPLKQRILEQDSEHYLCPTQPT